MPFFKRDKKSKSKPSSRASSQNNSRNDEETERDNPMEGYKLTLARSNDSLASEQSIQHNNELHSPPLSPHKEGGLGKLVRKASHKLLKFNKSSGSINEESSNSKREDDNQDKNENNSSAIDMNPSEVKEAVFSVQTQFFFNEKLFNVYHAILSNFMMLTKSTYGFMGEVKVKHDKVYVQVRITILKNEDGSFSKKKIKVNYDKFYKTVWGYSILNKSMLITSNPDDSRGSLTLPVNESQVPIVHSMLAVPFITTPSKRSKSVKVLAVATICNRPGGYSNQHLETLQPFTKTCSNLLEAHSNHQILKDQEGVPAKPSKKHSRSRSVSLDEDHESPSTPKSQDEAPVVVLRDHFDPKRLSSRPSSETFPPLKDSPSPTSSSPIGSISTSYLPSSPSSSRSPSQSFSRTSSYYGSSANSSVGSTPKSSPPNSPSLERHSASSGSPSTPQRPGLQRTLSEKTMKPEKEHHHHKDHKEHKEDKHTHKGRTNSLAFIFNPYLTHVSPKANKQQGLAPTKKRSASLPPNAPESPASSPPNQHGSHSLRSSKLFEIDIQHFAIKRKNELSSNPKTTFDFLKECVMNGDPKELAKYLKMKKFHPHINDYDVESHTLLQISVIREDYDIIETLLQFGAGLNLKNGNGDTALHLAVHMLNTRVMMTLLQADGIDPNILNKRGVSAFLDFCNTWDSPNSLRKMFDAFLARKADLNFGDRTNGETPLHKAILNPMMRVMIVKLLIEHSTNVNLSNNEGETPLHYAVRINRKEIIDDLLAAGADLNLANKNGKTPIEIADEMECTEEIKLKLKNTQELTQWFNKVGLALYVPMFLKENIFKDVFPFLTEKILKELGIFQAGDRIRILHQIEIESKQNQQQTPQTPPPTVTEGAAVAPPTPALEDLPTRPRAASGRQRPMRRKPETIPPFPSAVEELKKELEAETKWIKYTDLEFTQQLSAGSSGKVYKGYFNGAFVAIKVLEKTKEEEQVEEFKHEFKVFSAVRSPNVVQFYGASMEPRVCLVMEYCSRGSVYDILNDSLQFGWKQLLGFAIQMTMGIQCLHNCKPNQILHRDVKCMNFLVSENWCIKVCDFGLARSRTPSGNSTLRKLRGTTTHISPETCKGEEFTSKSDIFSLGICFWELAFTCITGNYQRPYQEFHLEPLQIVMQNPTGLRPTIPDNCPPKIADLIRTCWDNDPNNRPTCENVLQKLQECLKDLEQNSSIWLDSEHKRLATSEDAEAANTNNNNVANEIPHHSGSSSGSRGSNRSSDGNSELTKLRKLLEQTEGSLAIPTEQTEAPISLPVVQV